MPETPYDAEIRRKDAWGPWAWSITIRKGPYRWPETYAYATTRRRAERKAAA